MNTQTNENNRFFSGSRSALHCVQSALQDTEEVRIATAYFEGSGFQVLQETLRGKKIRLLIGRPEGGEDRLRQVLDEFIRELSQGSMEKRTSAMRQMLEALEQGWMVVSVGETEANDMPWMDARYIYHHAKLYIADRSAAVVTSANFSYHGLCISREAGYVVSTFEDVNYFVERFDYYFDRANLITQELIEALKKYLEAYDPYIIYARALLELYGLPEESASPKLPPLADYQKGVVSNVLHSLMEYDGAFLVASTGLGKTIIAAHVAAYLRMQGQIQTALVICPAGLREVWDRSMFAAHVPSKEYSYHTLTRLDGDKNIPVLIYDLNQVNSETLLIIDESHRFRNEDGTDGELRLSNERIQNAIRGQKGKVLLLTATPYGKDISEVQSQLNLLPSPKQDISTPLGLSVKLKNWKVDELAKLAELPPCTSLTTPDVVHHFGEKDKNGEHFVRFGQDIRYFPRRIRLITEKYTNPFDEFLAELLKSKLLYKSVDDTVQPVLFEELKSTRQPLLEALFLHQFCSSPAEVERVCNNLAGGTYEFELARQSELTEFINNHSKLILSAKKPSNDQKLTRLRDIIKDAGTQKVVVFCEYLSTAKYVKDGIQKLFDQRIKIDTTVDCPDLDKLLRQFAPVANEVLPEERNVEDEIQVLIASRAVSEGFNLQDASILVNYDLPWTVLQLAQRMGRILRPWKEPRDITIYNFVPSTMDNVNVYHARNWQKRLKERSRQHHSLAQIPVMVYEESRAENLHQNFEMEKLGRELYLAKDSVADLDLDQVMDFISKVGNLPTSSFYTDLAQIRNQDDILQLPAGIRSAIKKTGQKLLFLLLRKGRNQLYTVLADAHGTPLDESWRRDEVMRIIHCLPETPKAPFDIYPDDDAFDTWIERTRQQWGNKIGVEPLKLQVICALALVH